MVTDGGLLGSGKGAVAGGPKNRPAIAELLAPVRVTRTRTWPITRQTRYLPLVNAETVCRSSTAPLAASARSIVCARAWLSQSRLYSASSCAAPSRVLISIVNAPVEYQQDAILL